MNNSSQNLLTYKFYKCALLPFSNPGFVAVCVYVCLQEMNEESQKKGSKRRGAPRDNADDTEEAIGVRKKMKNGVGSKGPGKGRGKGRKH